MRNNDEDLLAFLDKLENELDEEYFDSLGEIELEEPKIEHYENEKFSIDFAIGYDGDGSKVNLNLIEAPHLLVCGKSTYWVLLNILYQLMTGYKYVDKVDFVICGSKEKYKDFDSLSCVINEITDDDNRVSGILKYIVNEMEHRFELMEKNEVRNIAEYNGKYSKEPSKKLKRIVIAIDDFNKLHSLNREVGNGIMRLTQKARAAGIHIILGATNIDSVTMSGYMLANIPVRLVSKVKDKNASMLCLNQGGAEKLNENEALLSSYSYKLQRVNLESEPLDLSPISFFYSDDKCKSKELEQYVDDYIKSKKPLNADLLNEVREFVKTVDSFYTSVIQRKFRIGYYKANDVLNQLVREGVIYRDSLGKPYYTKK